MGGERTAKKEEEVTWTFPLSFLYPSHQNSKESPASLSLHRCQRGTQPVLDWRWVSDGPVATLCERKARAATEYLRFLRSLHKLKPFISL